MDKKSRTEAETLPIDLDWRTPLDLEETPESSAAASSLTNKASAAAPRLLNTSDSANDEGIRAARLCDILVILLII